MGEQELYMMSDAGGTAPLLPEGEEPEIQMSQQERGERDSSASKWCKDEQNAQTQLKHVQLESEVCRITAVFCCGNFFLQIGKLWNFE